MCLELPSSRGDQEASGLASQVDGGRSEDNTAEEAGPPTNLMWLQLIITTYVVFIFWLTRHVYALNLHTYL